MVGTVLNTESPILEEDQLGRYIAEKWQTWNSMRQPKISAWEEIRKYIFATDTRATTNSKLPWKNTTTIPKLTQIRDNLYANYLAVEFPKRKWLDWLADEEDSNELAKRDAILTYMNWVISQPQYKYEMSKCILDYIDYGNCFALVEWIDQRKQRDDKIQSGYVGPMPRRISPLDIVFNPTAPTFIESPKIIRSMITVGELKKKLDSMTTDENRESYQELWNYLVKIRETARTSAEDLHVQDGFYKVDGFDSFREYLEGDYVEILTFYGDIFDWDSKTLLENHVIMVVDRHKVIGSKPNPSYFGYPPIFHAGWRIRQDNLWAMGPLDNLVGMQFQIDKRENMKADALDLIVMPMLKIKGYVNDFEIGPMQRIVTDTEGDVEILTPPYQVLQMDNQTQFYMINMEEMAGAPREAMGFRTPGEKTAFEVQRQENAGSRIFQNKTAQWDSNFHEFLLNAELEMAKRNLQGTISVNVFNDEFKMQSFMTLTADDITGSGRIKPMAARHFSEKAEAVQNLVNLYQSGLGQDPMVMVHMSGEKLAKVVEELLDLEEFHIQSPYVRTGEQAKMQRLTMAQEEQTLMQASTPAGMSPDDAAGPDLAQATPPNV
jgi:hypothetical protein